MRWSTSPGASAAVGAALVASALIGCGTDEASGDWALRVEGRAEVRHADGSVGVWRDGRHGVREGALVRVTAGRALLDLPGDAELELRAGTGGADDSSLRVAGGRPELVTGDALASARGEPVRVRAGAAEIDLLSGSARLRRATGVTVAVYRGRALVDAEGRSVEVPALRQLTVADTGSLPRRPSPIAFGDGPLDRWDRRFLGEAAELGRQLDRRSSAVSSLFGDLPVTAETLTDLLPDLARQPGWDPTLVRPERSLGETVVGALIALESTGGAFVDRWRQVFELRAQGARWSLVALDRGVLGDAALARVDGVTERTSLRLAAPVAAPAITSPVSPPAAPGPVPSPVAPVAPDPPPPAAPPSTQPPPTVPSRPAPPTTSPRPVAVPPLAVPPVAVLAPITDLLDRILGRDPHLSVPQRLALGVELRSELDLLVGGLTRAQDLHLGELLDVGGAAPAPVPPSTVGPAPLGAPDRLLLQRLAQLVEGIVGGELRLGAEDVVRLRSQLDRLLGAVTKKQQARLDGHLRTGGGRPGNP